jgi:MoaA/NifB/PqqE/SkfB family radical SAM enzyme
MRPAAIYHRLCSAVNYRLRTVAGGRWAHHCRPATITFLLTDRCNSRCVHCDIWKYKGRDEGLGADRWRTALRDVREWLGPVHVVLSGGEALLRPYTPELLAYGAELGLLVELLTHGYWEDQSRIERVALARPWRVTLSLDGMGETHDRIRRRPYFFERTTRSIETLKRIRQEEGLDFTIRLKTVLMAHNLEDAPQLARFATQPGVEIVFQAVEQNYASEEDPEWYRHSDTWPRDTERAMAAVERLKAMKREGYAIGNSMAQLDVMIPYFRDPAAWRVATQSHAASDRGGSLCSALTHLQVRSNGDVVVCFSAPPIGNLRDAPLREIWEARPQWWVSGCCRERRYSEAERARLATS